MATNSDGSKFIETIHDIKGGLPGPGVEIQLGDGLTCSYQPAEGVPLCSTCYHGDWPTEAMPCNDCEAMRDTGRSYWRESSRIGVMNAKLLLGDPKKPTNGS